MRNLAFTKPSCGARRNSPLIEGRCGGAKPGWLEWRNSHSVHKRPASELCRGVHSACAVISSRRGSNEPFVCVGERAIRQGLSPFCLALLGRCNLPPDRPRKRQKSASRRTHACRMDACLYCPAINNGRKSICVEELSSVAATELGGGSAVDIASGACSDTVLCLQQDWRRRPAARTISERFDISRGIDATKTADINSHNCRQRVVFSLARKASRSPLRPSHHRQGGNETKMCSWRRT